MRLMLLILLLAAAPLSVVAEAPGVAVSNPPPELTVFAAASLKESLDAVTASWEAQSGQRVVLVYAGSGALARQIDQGAPAQVFFSADQAWMRWLQDRGRIDVETKQAVLGNRLVLIAPAASPGPVAGTTPADALPAGLGDHGRLAIGAVDSVPAGGYARLALQQRGLWEAVRGRLAEAEDVRAAMAFVARGEAPLGIVYATDAKVEPRVRIVIALNEDMPDADIPLVSVIRYPVARVAGADPAVTDGFLHYLHSPPARAIFVAAGFDIPRPLHTVDSERVDDDL